MDNDKSSNIANQQSSQLEGGTYEILQNRLKDSSQQLQDLLTKLNTDRKDVFGSIETTLIGTERVTTENNCIPWDMVPVGDFFLFGYNVHIGLKTETQLSDVFSVYKYEGHNFAQDDLDAISDKAFVADFKKLYKYYKNTQFVKFFKSGPYLHMVFRVGKELTDVKTFKWQIQGSQLKYVDNRSDHEFKFPEQYDFKWVKTTRDNYRQGQFPHVSILDKVFVETVGGDLTIKVEDNTDDGSGIYEEPVEHKDQTLDDAEIFYAEVGNIIILKIRPYQEDFRYIVYNAKIGQARRIDELKDSCILLPDDHGIIFTNGYYLQTGEFKKFDNELESMIFERRIASPNGEDYLYVFYNRASGTYLLLHYNLIEQKAENPTICHGYSLFENGEMCLFRADEEAKKHHVVQIWQTPYTGADFEANASHDSYLFKIGNKEVVRAMAECNEITRLINKEDSYTGLYLDLIKLSTDILDTYHWIKKKEAHELHQPLEEVRQVASSAVDEFEKVVKIRQNTAERIEEVSAKADELIKEVKKTSAKSIDVFVKHLSELRKIRGEIISLKDLRYSDLEKVQSYEDELSMFNDKTSEGCVKFLLKDEALQPYNNRVDELKGGIEKVNKVVDAVETGKQIEEAANELEMLIEIVSNLKIGDATQTTKIIDDISNIYSHYNQLKAALKNKRKQLLSVEGKAEFNAQIKLIDQGVINFIDISDTPEKCDEYITKLMVQLEELEGKFSEFDDFINQITIKREEIYNAFENKKQNLIERKNKRANTLQQAGERILNAVKSRVSRFDSVNEINGYYAADLMIEKVRAIIQELSDIGDTIKSDDIVSKLKTIKEDAVRQLKDKSELFVDGENLIKFGKHTFTVNTQPLDLSIVNKGDDLYYHLVGTNFFEKIEDKRITEQKETWDQELVSESKVVYRAEYLVYSILEDKETDVADLYEYTGAELTKYITKYMSVRFNEGYLKGVHDHDATLLLRAILNLIHTADLLRYSSEARALAALFWKKHLSDDDKKLLNHQLKGAGIILKVFPDSDEFEDILVNLKKRIINFNQEAGLFNEVLIDDATEYLFYEISRGDQFVVDKVADDLYHGFVNFLKEKKAKKSYDTSIKSLEGNTLLSFHQIKNWVNSYVKQEGNEHWAEYVDEVTVILLADDYLANKVVHAQLKSTLEGFQGSHSNVVDGKYELNFNHYMMKLRDYQQNLIPKFLAFGETKKNLAREFGEALRLEEFKPRIMSSFVRNKLIDELYLSLIGNNFAKQMGAAGDSKRTDLMGLLLLISPPGYGKTTLMEYIANRLGIIFMKINGPALGHDVVALDPEQAPNLGAKEELKKLNLAFEMGDNVMIYLDDIQHCNPEFLQKFISLCDAQRKIEGVYKGKGKTYDFRGKKVCVVMAGNPYTESGDKFRIPDMLANRADIYNLGDIIGETEDVFKLSYIENCMTSNTVMAKLQGKSQKDVHAMIQIAETDSKEGVEFEANHSVEEINEYVNILKKILKVRDAILAVNMEYIRSAGQADEYRTEPPFKLQGSYRDMNKIAEKVVSVMNDKELDSLVLSHYESESQTLTSGAEANLLKFKFLINKMSKTEKDRWEEILEKFRKKQEQAGYGSNQAAMLAGQMENISTHLEGIKEEMLILNIKQKGKKNEK